ncbi:helix-turn-helix domain-containing protein [Desulfoscipio gibsoniae]
MKRNRLVSERKKRDLTSEQLAQIIGISKAMVSHIENGRHWPSGKVIMRLEQFFGIPASKLLAESEQRQQ